MNALAYIAGIFKSIEYILRFIHENKNEEWFKKGGEVFSALSTLDTQEKRREVASKINDLYKSL